jgi:alpha/beta superfamily hydrolase
MTFTAAAIRSSDSHAVAALRDTSQRSRALRSIDLKGPAGRLEALLNEGAPDAPCAALVCHPHPLGGGTMHNKVVYHAMKALNDPAFGLGWPVLRFNFRGTGLSQGVHHGEAEAEDVLAALDWLKSEYDRPLVVVGYSFGAVMALTACCGPAQSQKDIRAIAALGLPLQAEGDDYRYPFLAACTFPKLFLSGDLDQYASAQALTQVVDSSAEPKRLLIFAGADHFFTGQLEPMQSALAGWLKEQLQ